MGGGTSGIGKPGMQQPVLAHEPPEQLHGIDPRTGCPFFYLAGALGGSLYVEPMTAQGELSIFGKRKRKFRG